MLNKSFKVVLHVGFWLAYLVFLAMIMFAAFQGREMPPEDRGYYFWFVCGIGIVTLFFWAPVLQVIHSAMLQSDWLRQP